MGGNWPFQVYAHSWLKLILHGFLYNAERQALHSPKGREQELQEHCQCSLQTRKEAKREREAEHIGHIGRMKLTSSLSVIAFPYSYTLMDFMHNVVFYAEMITPQNAEVFLPYQDFKMLGLSSELTKVGLAPSVFKCFALSDFCISNMSSFLFPSFFKKLVVDNSLLSPNFS